MSTINAAEYRYFTADLLTNTVLMEIPFKNVSYERSIKGAGAFSGRIPMIEGTESLDLYETTMPGKTALYVVRDNVCVWGGIIWDRSYSAKSRELTVNGSEFTSYFYHRLIWKTFTHDFSATIVVTGGTAALTLDNGEYEFPVGSSIRVIFYHVGDFQYNGYYTVLSSPAPTSTTCSFSAPSIPNGTYTLATIYIRTDAYDYMRQLLDTALIDFINIQFPNDEIEPATSALLTVTNKALTSNVATLTTSTAHELVPGQVVDVVNIDSTFDGSYEVTSVPTTTTFTYELVASNVASTGISGITANISNKQCINNVATLTTSASHGLVAGDYVEVSGVDNANSPITIFNGFFTIASAPTSTTFTYTTFSATDVSAIASAGTVTLTRSAYNNSYGPFPANSDIGIDYSTEDFASQNLENKTYRGFELRSVGEELDEYSDTVDGFEYRIDCNYDPVTGSFARTLVFIPIDFPNPPAPGEVSPVSRFGADRLVFEFPGNIEEISIKESAENAATRFFTVGNIGDLGDDASQPYAAASATDLLNAGWPLLDQEEAKNDISSESELYDHAERYLNEFRPPVGDITVSVNGSLEPIIGTYFPGDWCSIVANDSFIQQRLSSDLEVRDTVLVRKIDSIKVSVPDSPSFPERVDLELVTEWEVDRRGQ